MDHADSLLLIDAWNTIVQTSAADRGEEPARGDVHQQVCARALTCTLERVPLERGICTPSSSGAAHSSAVTVRSPPAAAE
jgi:hypothetical protein